MTKNPFDKAARFAARIDPEPFLGWVLNLSQSELVFREWLDTRNIPFPEGDDRTGDTVACVEQTAQGGVPWALAVEFQLEPDPLMFGRLGRYLNDIWLAHKPDDLRASRFQLGGIIFNLTGRGNAARNFHWPEANLQVMLTPREINLEYESAETRLGEMESGSLSRVVLPWIPLMAGADTEGIIDRWKLVADQEPDHRRRSTFGGLALVMAEAAGRRQLWETSLKGWNMRESIVVNNWIEEGRVEGRQEGLQEGRQEGLELGQRAGRLELLQAQLSAKFGELKPESLDRLRALSNDELKAMSVKLFTATALSDLGL